MVNISSPCQHISYHFFTKNILSLAKNFRLMVSKYDINFKMFKFYSVKGILKITFSISTESSANHCLASFCCTTQATCRQAGEKMRDTKVHV